MNAKKTVKLTIAQREALEMLAERPRTTTTHTLYESIGGQTANSLIKKGYARRRFSDNSFGSFVVEITDTGRAALA